MKKSLLAVVLLILVMLTGIYIGYYITAVRYEYIKAYNSGSEAFITLNSLKNEQLDNIKTMQQVELLGSFSLVNRLPRWANQFNPNDSDSPIRESRIQERRDVLSSLKEEMDLSLFQLSESDLKRILDTHFSHSISIKMSQSFIDEINQKIWDSETNQSQPVE